MKNGKDPEPHQESADISHRTEQQEVTKGIASESVLNRVKSGESNDRTQNQPKKYYFREDWKATWSKWEAIEKFTFVLLIFTFFSSASDVYQSYMMRETLVAGQRPAVHLGLPDGKIADFVLSEGKEEIALYFRNYGQSTARITVVETWTVIVDSSDYAVSGVRIPPPEEKDDGPDLPPGFPYTYYRPVPEVTREALTKGEKGLFIVGRVRYTDSFTQYCNAFTIRYARKLATFALQRGHTVGSFDPCQKDAAHSLSFVVVPGQGENVVVEGKQEKKTK